VADLNVNNEVTFINSEGTKCVGSLNAISRHYVTLEIYHPEAVVQLSEVLTDLQIKRNERVIYRGRAVVSSLIDTAMTLLVSVSLLEDWQDLADVTHAPDLILQEARRFVDDWEQERDVDPDFQMIVNEMRSFFFELSRWLSHVDPLVERAGGDRQSLEQQVLGRLSEALLPVFEEKLERFEQTAEKIGDNETTVLRHRHMAQRELHPLVLRSPWMYRTYSKPLGFAGDYEMVNMMLRSPYEGPRVSAKMLNSAFLSVGPVYAHRNRLQILYELLKDLVESKTDHETPLRILNIGCGPAIEIQNLMRLNPELANRCEFVLMDFSADALEYTKTVINNLSAETGSAAAFEFVNERVQTLLRRAAKARMEADTYAENYDLCYCAGLFDYLPDKVCKNLIRFMLQLCKPGGLVVVTNVHTSNTATNMMEFLMEWNLIYRDERQMQNLLPPDCAGDNTFTDETGINIFMKVVRG
jgi:extracellular factor (EF) 3-hydroxypalmitic acid methyl ester biosynthesis protein